jgi:hypothetical protein
MIEILPATPKEPNCMEFLHWRSMEAVLVAAAAGTGFYCYILNVQNNSFTKTAHRVMYQSQTGKLKSIGFPSESPRNIVKSQRTPWLCSIMPPCPSLTSFPLDPGIKKCKSNRRRVVIQLQKETNENSVQERGIKGGALALISKHG